MSENGKAALKQVQGELKDAISDLRDSNLAEGTCPEHKKLVHGIMVGLQKDKVDVDLQLERMDQTERLAAQVKVNILSSVLQKVVWAVVMLAIGGLAAALVMK